MSEWILVVDDDEDVRESMVMILEYEGFTAKSAANGSRAVEAITVTHRENPPSLIFLDIWMPVMNGVSFLRERRNDPLMAQIPTYLFSADMGLAKVASEFEATGHIAKPVEMVEVIATAARHVQRS
jgi:CheY-like chemotaxis protein